MEKFRMETKKCNKCNQVKNFPEDFTVGKKSCKKCRNSYLKGQRDNKLKSPKRTKEEIYNKQKEWRKKNPERRAASVTKYHLTHKEQEAEYRKKNSEKILKRVKNFVSENREALNLKLRIRRKNPIVKLRHSVSILVRFNINGIKCGSILKFLPYTIQELKDHLEKQFEPWMNWNNWGVYDSKIWNDNDQSTWTWQLDHIIPQSDLPYISMEDDNFKKCWELSNLRPYSAKQNLLDGTQRTRHFK
jgi:hypothetical protein